LGRRLRRRKISSEFIEASSAPTETSENSLARRLGRRKISWGVDWDVGRSLGALTETSRDPFAALTETSKDPFVALAEAS